ncbi:universal stress protein [Achromobacter sp. NFACC18-2]|uniref:universal stress protein n=1 Tax=Achromobacter sp. NFACC18-2 TaxID=1564112 RepID=UPI0008C1B813|nr:universal stress protein [Achromobacter sp. NFACC18-2]SEK10118.1 Nucleotide-binding universal stress protein, UspA family [Achromobacter sp. NFACC18-2]
MKRILIPVDGSEPALNAVKALLDARRYDPVERVDLLAVQLPLQAGAFGSGLSQEEIDAYHQEEGEAALQAARDLLTQSGVPFETHILAGSPAETIARVADETGANEIFMGTRGLGSVSAFFMGSVATGVLSLTDLPITLVK